MPESRGGVLREIAWLEICPWLILVRVFRLAIQLRMLLLSSAAVLLTIFGWWVIGYIFGGGAKDVEGNPTRLGAWIEAYKDCPFVESRAGDGVTRIMPAMPEPPRSLDGPPMMGDYPGNPYLGAWHTLSGPIRQVFDRHLTFVELAFLLLCGLWAIAVWALFGGAITRIAAMKLGREESVGTVEALRFARKKWASYFAAPLFPLLGVLLAVIPMALAGFAMRLAVGTFVMGLFWPLMLVGGVVMSIFLLGLTFGWPLMWSTISTEGNDSFDALSRSYSYVFQRPLQFLFYAAVAIFLGLLGWLLAFGFSQTVVYLTEWAASWGSGGARMDFVFGRTVEGPSGMTSAGATMIAFWAGCVHLLVLGFVYSYFWTASSAIYLLLRRDVDGTDMDEVYVADQAETYGMPPLEKDAAGVPIVSSEASVAGNNGASVQQEAGEHAEKSGE